ncbi:MAG TPA: glycosyltransferase [Chthoniobacterales bacterium]
MKPTIGIGISTRDRWGDLEITLLRLESFGMDWCKTVLVIDDGSQQPVSDGMRERFPRVIFERSPEPRGYIVQRNQLARVLPTDLYLSLDDDSFPEVGDIALAAEWLIKAPTVAALCFSIIPGGDGSAENYSFAPNPAPIRFYIGCAHLVKRELFLQLGGYREELEHYTEEQQFSLVAMRHGLAIYHYPDVIVRHLRSPAGRTPKRAHRLLTRNDVYCAMMYYPFLYLTLSIANCLPRQFRNPAHRPYLKSVTKGFLEALLTAPRVWKYRAPLSIAQMHEWRSYPHPWSVVKPRG